MTYLASYKSGILWFLQKQKEGGMIWENDILTCILSCELNRQSMSDAGYSMLGAGAWG